jgi:hypothetical protein
MVDSSIPVECKTILLCTVGCAVTISGDDVNYFDDDEGDLGGDKNGTTSGSLAFAHTF